MRPYRCEQVSGYAFSGSIIMAADPVLIEQGADGVATVTLNRPDMHNALDDNFVSASRAASICWAATPLAAWFCLKPMVQVSALAPISVRFNAVPIIRLSNIWPRLKNLALMMKTLYEFPKPLLGLVLRRGGWHRPRHCLLLRCSGGQRCQLPPVRSEDGLVPAVISPYVVRAIGLRAAQRYFITAEPFSASDAKTLGLVHELVPDRMMTAAAAKMIERITLRRPQGADGGQGTPCAMSTPFP